MMKAKRESIRPDDDAYATPVEFTRALFAVEAFGGGIWDPCAGSGALVDEIRKLHKWKVFATTIGEGSGRGPSGIVGHLDFFGFKNHTADNIIMNPPYHKGMPQKFVTHALSLNPVKIAALMNVRFFGGEKRGRWLEENPPVRVHAFSNRVSMYPEGYSGEVGSTTENFAWFIWERYRTGDPVYTLINSKEFRDAK